MQVLSVDLFTWTDDPLLIGGSQIVCQDQTQDGHKDYWNILRKRRELKMRSIIYWGHSFKLNHIYVISFQLLLNISKNRFKCKHIRTDTVIIKDFWICLCYYVISLTEFFSSLILTFNRQRSIFYFKISELLSLSVIYWRSSK